MIKKIKEYFTSKPKGNFWMHAFFILLLFQYVTPFMLTYLTFLQIGLLAPNADLTATIDKAKVSVTEALVSPMITMQEVGQKIALDNPLIAKILAYALANFIWLVWVGFIFVIIDLSRFGIAWAIKKIRKNAKEGKKK